MEKKPSLDEILKATKPKKSKPRKSDVKHSLNKELNIQMIHVWIPHLVAHSFNRITSLMAAFPKRKFSNNTASLQAQRLMKMPEFYELMQKHIGKIEERLKVDENFVIGGLYQQSIANVFDYFDVDTDGNMAVKEISAMPAELQRNVKKISINNTILKEEGEVQVLKQRINLEVVDSQKALALLGKAMGMFVERHEIEVTGNVAEVLEHALERVKRGKTDKPAVIEHDVH